MEVIILGVEQKIKEMHRELFGGNNIDNCTNDNLIEDILNHLKDYNIIDISLPELILTNEDNITEADTYEYEEVIDCYADASLQCGIPF